MAKNKGEKASPFVPVEEQPYQVPENWCWVTVETINHYSGSSIDPTTMPDDTFELYSVPSSANDFPEIVTGAEIGSTKQTVMEGDVLLCKINPRINRVWLVSKYTENVLLASSEWIIIRNEQFDSRYLMYCFRTQFFRKYMLSNVSGVGGSLMRAQPKFVKGYPVPVAPLPEQKRIVERIESLFAKLDEAKKKTQEVMENFKIRKAVVLQKAFSGELTRTFSPFPNHNKTLEDVCFSIYDGDHMPPPKSDDGIAFLVISDVNTGHLSFEKTRFVPKDYYDSLTDTRKPQPGDVLYTLVGSYGIAVLVDSDRPFCFQRHMALLKPDSKKILSQYLWYILQSNDAYEQATAIATGTAQLTIPIKGLRKLRINVPDLEKQKEIVHILDDFFAKEAEAKTKVEATLEAIEAMKKSILAKAFRGELGTNNPEDESAEELLKRTLA